jgi:PAS domain-containing protein
VCQSKAAEWPKEKRNGEFQQKTVQWGYTVAWSPTDLVSVFTKIPWADVARAARRLLLKEPFVLVSAVLLLLAGAALQYSYWSRSNQYEAVMERTLQARLEETPQRYKGLEAFILSSFSTNVEKPLSESVLSPKFVAEYEGFEDALDTCLRTLPDPAESVKTLSYGGGEDDDTLITDGDPRSYLFFPVHILRAQFSQAEYKQLSGDDSQKATDLIRKKVAEDGQLTVDVALSQCAIPWLDKFTRNPFTSNEDTALSVTPTQAYFITKSGLMRIVSRKKLEFNSQFPATLFFPGRPYFWAAFDQTIDSDTQKFDQHLTERIGQLFSVSQPYLDLGGNGIVVTACEALRRNGMPDSALCLDLPLKEQNLERYVEGNVSAVGGTVATVDCTGEDCVGHAQNSADPKLVADLSNYIVTKKDQGSLGEVYGNIEVINENVESPGLLEVSVPVSPRIPGANGNAKANFVVFRLDLGHFGRTTAWLGAASGACFGIAVLLLGFSLAEFVGREIELREAFEKVAEVMYHSPTPYSRLGADDKIQNANLAFCELLGRDATDDEIQRLKKVTFRTLCAPESLAMYDEIQKKRTNHEPVDPYPLTLVAKGGKRLVMIYSAAVPSAIPDQTGLPETFGVALIQDV